MPHIVIEYSQNLETEIKKVSLLNVLYKIVLYSGIFLPVDIKVHAISYNDYISSEEVTNLYTLPHPYFPFIHPSKGDT